MRTVILAATIAGFSMGGVLAQTTGPAGQDNMKTNNTMSKDGMNKDGMNKDGMKKGGMKGTGTTTGASKADRATVPGSLNSGGTSETSPNTAQPGSSKIGN
ncbi:hypothetical protein BH10PSE10_BH10PSE10_24470 [soil metagenome]